MEKLKVKFPFATPRTRQSEREKAKDGTRETKQSTNKDPTGTIRQRRYVKKWKNTEKMKKQNQAKCKKYQEKLKLERKKNPTLDRALKKKERERKALYRHKKEMKNKSSKANIAASNANDPTEVQTREAKSKKEVDKLKRKLKTTQQRNRRNAKKSTIQSPEAIRKRASRVKKTLPTSPVKWAHTVSHIVRNASPRKKVALQGLKKKNCNSKKSTTRVSRSKLKREIWKKKVETFLLRDDISRQMPNKKDVLKVNGNLVAKRHLLLGKKEAYMKFREENSDYPFRYTSFRRSIPKQIKKMKLSNRRVCVCLKCFNMTEMVSCLNEVKQKGTAPFNIRSLYKDSVCQATGKFPDLACIEGKCALCKNRFKKTHQALVNANRDKMIKYCQWEQVNRKVKNSKGQTVEKKFGSRWFTGKNSPKSLKKYAPKYKILLDMCLEMIISSFNTKQWLKTCHRIRL